MKKIIILIIILSYLHSYFGCVSTASRAYAPSEFTRKNDASITITTHDLKIVTFDASTYSVKNDTLYGQVMIDAKDSSNKKRWIKIALCDIKDVTGTERYVSTITYIFWGTVASLIILAILFGDGGDSGSGPSSGGQWSM